MKNIRMTSEIKKELQVLTKRCIYLFTQNIEVNL